MEPVLLLLLVPMLSALLVLPVGNLALRYVLSGGVLILLSFVALEIFLSQGGGVYAMNHLTHWVR